MRAGSPFLPRAHYTIDYSDATINLLTMGNQRTLDVRFPMTSQSDAMEDTKNDNAYWTNHPECVRRTWAERITSPPAQGAERWFHIEFNLAPLMDTPKSER